MSAFSRLGLSLAAIAAAALVVAGCASTPQSAPPTNTATPGGDAVSEEPGDDADDFEAAWLDDGRMFAIVTMGSSTCVPQVADVTADGQNVAVTLADADADAACTADMAPRASIGAFPEGVDPTKDVKLTVTYGDIVDDVDLDGSPEHTGIPGTATEYIASAGWFDDRGLVLLTWGSSSCVPTVASVEGAGAAGTVTFADQKPGTACTMDMSARATIVSFADDVDDDAFELTLVGDNLDATVRVLQD